MWFPVPSISSHLLPIAAMLGNRLGRLKQSKRLHPIMRAALIVIALTGGLGVSLLTSIPAHAASSLPSWWTSDCDGRVAAGTSVLVVNDSTLGLQVCYPTNYNGTQPDWSETIPGAVSTQLEWECVELSERHLAQHHNMPNKGPVGGGKNVAQYYYNWYSSGVPGLMLITGGTTQVFPSPGDVLSTTWGGTSNGHTSVIALVNITNAATGNATLTVDQQNVQGGGVDGSWAVATITISNWQYTWSAGALTNLQVLHFGATVNPNLYVMQRSGTGTNSTEVHILDSSTNFQSYVLNTGTALSQTGTDASWAFLVGDYNGDGKPDVYAIHKTGTQSGKTEVHILNGADNFQTYLLHQATAQNQAGSDLTYIYGMPA